MNIERLFGKSRGAKASSKPRGQDEPRPRTTAPTPPVPAEPPAPRMVATDAPASLSRASEEPPAVVPVAAAGDPAPADAPSPPPTYEQIAARAYELWMEQGRPEGRERENWLEAERLLIGRQGPA